MQGNLLRRVLAAKATLFVGLAMMVAVVLGAASTVQAHTGYSGLFHLNHSNTVSGPSELVGSVTGDDVLRHPAPILRLDNNSTGLGATALDLEVAPGKAPMTVSSSARVANLNADRLDNLSAENFLSRSPYAKVKTEPAGPGKDFVQADCDPGDRALSGGFAIASDATHLLGSRRVDASGFPTGWRVDVNPGNNTDAVTAEVYCWDRPPLRN